MKRIIEAIFLVFVIVASAGCERELRATVEIALREDRGPEGGERMVEWLESRARAELKGVRFKADLDAAGERIRLAVPGSQSDDLLTWLKAWQASDPIADFSMRTVHPRNLDLSQETPPGGSPGPEWEVLPSAFPGDLPYVVAKEIIVDASHVEEAYAQVSGGSPQIVLRFGPQGARKMGEFTAAHVGESIAIIVEGEVQTTPRIQQPFSSGAVVVGNFTEEEARELASRLTEGPPLRFDIVRER